MRRAPAPVPSLAERQRPGLSAMLTGPVHPNACQACGIMRGHVRDLRRWRECDEWDKATRVIVVLCAECSDRLIEPHARLYIAIEHNAPLPGAMDLCSLCRHRDGTRCASPLLKANGGAGLRVEYSRPSEMFIDGTGFHGCVRTYAWPPVACAGREAVEPTAAP